MAVAVVAGIAAVGGAAVSAVVAGTALTFGAAAAAFAIGAGLSVVSRAIAPKPKLNTGASLAGLTATVREPATSKKIVYGRSRIGGTVVYIDTTGTDNEYLHLVIALAGHEIDAFESVYFNDEKVWQGTYQSGWGSYTRIKFYKGDQTTADSDLVSESTPWTSNHILRDTAYLYVRLKYDADQFPNGIPNVSAVVRGKKIYDPRQDSTSSHYDASVGVNTHRVNDSSTWTWSQNPALAVRDYLVDAKYGLGEDAALINSSALVTAADYCDIALDSNSDPIPQLQINGIVDTANSRKENIDSMLSAMGGMLVYSGGSYFIRAAQYVSPTITIDESVMVGQIQVQTRQSRRSQYNGVKGVFLSKEKNYTVADYPAQISSTYATEDGDPIYLDMPLPFVTDNEQAQRLAKVALLKSRQQTVITVPVNLAGLKFKAGDVIQITNDRLGYDQKPFEVVDYAIAIEPSGGIRVDLRCIETASSIYNWLSDDASDFLSGGELSLYDGKTTQPPTSLTATESTRINSDGAVIPTIELAWTAAADAFVDHYEVEWKQSTASTYKTVNTVGAEYEIPVPVVGVTYNTRVRAVNGLGVRSSYATANVTMDGDTTAPASPTSPGTSADVHTLVVSWTNPSDLDLSYIEVKRNSVNTEGTATVVGRSSGTSFVDGPFNVATTYYYWVRAVDNSGNASSWVSAGSDTTVAVGTTDLADDSVTIDKIANTLQSTNYSAGSAGWKLTTDGTFEAGDGTFRGALTATSGSISSSVTIGGTAASTVVSGAADGATALQNGDDITDGTIGGVTITSTKLYQGTGTFQGSTTGFYLDSDGQFSLKDKFSFDGTELFVDGNIEVSDYVRAGSGANTAIISGRDVDEFAFWAGAGFQSDGGPSGGNAPFRVTRDGKVIMTNFALYSQSGTKLFDSQDGLLALPQTAVAQASGTLVPQVSEELTSGTDTFTVTLSSTQTITANFSYPVGALYYSGTSLANALSNVSSAFAVTLEYSDDSGSTWNTFGSTQNFTRVTSGTPTSSQFFVDNRELTISIVYGAEPQTIYIASLQSDRGAIDEGMALVGSTSQSLAAGTYLIRMAFSATGGSGTGAPATNKVREVRLSTSGAGFTVSDGTVSDGVGTSATTGWVLQNFVEKTESDDVTINGTLTLGGDLVVNGTTTTINSTTLEVADKNIVLADGAANAAAADGAGITIDGASASLTYHSTTDSFRFNKATAFGFNNIDVDAFGSYAGGFGTIQDGSGWSARGLFVHGGGTGDGAAIAHNGSGLYFGIQNNAAANSLATWLYVSPSKVIDFNGTLSMNNTSFMDSSRNLSNIGTISSGAITANGTSAFGNFRLIDASKMGFGTVKAGSTISHTASTEEGIFWHSNADYGIYRTSGAWGSPDYQQMRIKWVTGIELDGGSAYGKSGVNIINSDLQIGGTTVIDSGRAISAASMTTSGAVGVGGNLDVDGIIDNTRNNGSVAAPSTSDHTAGTRIKFYDASPTAFYAMGIENSTLWFNSDANYKWYVDAALKVDFDANGVVNAVGGYKVGGTEIINSSGSVVGAPTITLADNATDTAAHRIAVYDSGNVSYGMMLWNDSGAAGDWGTMIYGPNQANRTISFGKIIDSTFTNHGDVRQIAYFDLDNGSFVHKGQTGYDTIIRAYGQGSSDDALLQLLGQGNNPGQEGFEIWYDNDVGEVSLSTTYSNAAADMHFRTGTGATKSTSNTRLTLHGDGNATLYANPNSIASFQTIPSSAGYNYINIAGTDGNDSGIIFSEGDGNTAANRRMMIGYDAASDYLRFYTYYRGDGTTAVNSNRAEIDTYGNLNIVGAYEMDGSDIIDANRQIISSRSHTTGHISKFINTNTGTSAYSEVWVQNGTTADRLVLGYSKNYSSSEWSGKGWVYVDSAPLALKTPQALQIYTGGFTDAYISATYDSSGNYAHLRGKASFDDQVKIKASSHPSAAGVALTVGDAANEGLRFGEYGHLLSSDTHIAHNIYWTGAAWAQISGTTPSSTIKLGTSSAADISFGYTDAGSTSINYAYEFPKSGKARFDTSLTIGGADIGTRNGLSITSAANESQAVFQSSNYSAAFGILSHDNATYLSQNIYYDGGAWVHDSYNGEQRNVLLAIRAQGSGHGIYLYASDNGTSSWNLASNVQLFNGYGYCTADITTNNFRSTAPHFLTSETLELGDYGSSWGHPYISMASSWASGTYPTIGSTGGSAGSLIMLHNPHIPFRTDNNASGQTGKGGIRCAIDSVATSYYDVGTYSMTGVTEGFQVARGGVRYIYTTGDDNVIFADNIYVDNGNLRIGDQAFSQSAAYVGMKTAYQSGSGDYMIISGTSDGNTYVSAKSGASVYIRGGGNASSNQIRVHDSATITATTSNFSCTGNVTAYSDERLKSDVQTLDGAKVLAMRGVSFTKDGEAGSGVIAQELEKVAPELVHTADDEMGTKSVAYGNLVGYLIEAVKMQQQQIDELKALLKEKDNGND